MDRWTAKAALIVVFGVVVSALVLLPSARSEADTGPAQYRKFVPLVAGDSATGSTPGSQGSPASDLASELTSANGDAARVATLEKLSKALGIGVYAADGTPIVTGAEQSSQDFYYYEPEIVTMAASLGRGERWSFDDVAAFLNGDGLLANGATVTALQVRAGVAKAISEAEANAGATASFEPVFVHQLGLKHTPADDLADTSMPTSAPVLDAAQRAVILDDFLIGLDPGEHAGGGEFGADDRGAGRADGLGSDRTGRVRRLPRDGGGTESGEVRGGIRGGRGKGDPSGDAADRCIPRGEPRVWREGGGAGGQSAHTLRTRVGGRAAGLPGPRDDAGRPTAGRDRVRLDDRDHVSKEGADPQREGGVG